MNEEKFSNQIQELLEVPVQMDYTGLALEIGSLVIILPALFLIYKNTIRPGRVMMFFGYLLSTLCYLPVLAVFYSVEIASITGMGSWIVLYMPMTSVMFALVAAIGFLIFSFSFKNES
jgi:hypothetical protein